MYVDFEIVDIQLLCLTSKLSGPCYQILHSSLSISQIQHFKEPCAVWLLLKCPTGRTHFCCGAWDALDRSLLLFFPELYSFRTR
jgi:hypothetical protein